MKYLRQLVTGVEVEPIVAELAAHPELWNANRLRTTLYGGPHNDVSDIWVRYRCLDELDASRDPQAIADFVGQPHESVWYPAIDVLPTLRQLIFEVARYFDVERLGGVLITRIPAGSEVSPHVDHGWHARYYEKIALQIKSAPGQAFCFEDGEFECEPGTLYAFDNSHSHWVTNKSQQERITCIICVRRDQRLKPLHCGEGE